MHYKVFALLALFCTTSLVAQNVYDVYPERVIDKNTKEQKSKKENKRITGFTGGMKLHMGYAFASSPDELFHNGSLQHVSGLSQDGVTMGLGGELRLHLINHIHLGIDGGMSIMPLKYGSSIRQGWGGVLCDYYGTVGKKLQLCIGGVIGGGTTKRLYVPEEATQVRDQDEVVYNASYTQTPYFLLDPYVGMDILLNKRIALLIKVDYMLPFGQGYTGIDAVRWSNFLAPSGPRLYVGVMFGRQDKGH